MFEIEPIGFVRNTRSQLIDDDWDSVPARIELVDALPPETLEGLEEFSHAEVIYPFHRVGDSAIERGARHPRETPNWPRVGIFAQRAKDRPNRLGATIVEVKGRQGRVLTVAGLDAIDGTPVLDIKPVMAEFLPRSPVRQPDWSRELMKNYWSAAGGS